jgi:dTDP-4-dehydrorhamnose reductase
MIKLLVTGGNGQLGWELAQRSSAQYEIHALTRAQLDITDRQQVAAIITELQPDIVINTAAYTAVDKAEQESEQAFAINHKGAEIIAEACAQANRPLLHLSTDYVFNGEQREPYHETDMISPINKYGASKWAGEIAVRGLWDQHIILRVSGVFSVHGHNFVKTILRLAQERETLRIVADQIICPTPAADIAETILVICKNIQHENSSAKSIWGTYHYCSSEPTTWHQFAEAIIALAAPQKKLAVKEIIPITTAEFPLPAKRPAYSVLDCRKIQKYFDIETRSWRKGLEEVVKRL